ncbi:MAG: GreA/GreB family elongation factor [Candidatus Magasanikbacteria bacterium]|nr:GreA/GreB family elongation factor [Candidatus Magasanikbacteria bacterium]
MKQDPLLTAEKLEDLKKKLEHLKDSKPFAASEVARLAELGDFSENVEYQMAKGRLRGINGGIFNLQNQIDNAVLIENSDEVDQVRVGNTVTVEMNGKTKTYKLLGSVESDPSNGVISHNSPVGIALMDKKVGEEFEIERENGNIKCKIISITNI